MGQYATPSRGSEPLFQVIDVQPFWSLPSATLYFEGDWPQDPFDLKRSLPQISLRVSHHPMVYQYFVTRGEGAFSGPSIVLVFLFLLGHG